jgi:hypothetical protein
MKKLLHVMLFAVLAMADLSHVSAEQLPIQRDFPTGGQGSNVSYLDAAGPGHPTACVITITEGLPELGVALSIFSNGKFTIMVASQRPIPNIVANSNGTMKVNSVNLFLTVVSNVTSGSFHALNLAPAEDTPLDSVYEAVNQIVYNTTRIDLVADDAHMPAITIAAQAGLGAALEACQRYMMAHL